MNEHPFAITKLNDFIFCPASIYFHEIDAEADVMTFQSEYQINGSAIHEKTDRCEYSDRRDILQAISIYSERYNLYGRIDVFDVKVGKLIERKKHVNRIYDGYVYQVYAQCFGLREMGYEVKELMIHSYDDNKNWPIDLPENNTYYLHGFENLIDEINSFSLDGFSQINSNKCYRCIYEPLCSYSAKVLNSDNS